jgi:hypothetical protein
MNDLTPANANRLAVGIARSRGIPYQEAEKILRTLSLRVVADQDYLSRVAGQSALLTVVNCAHRAFLGGVDVRVPAGIASRLPLGPLARVDELTPLTGCIPAIIESPTLTLFLGTPAADAKHDDILVQCDGWRGGASDVSVPAAFANGDVDDFALGGILAGGIAVHRAFVRALGLPGRCLDGPSGLSLWDPYSNWLEPVSVPRLRNIPTRYWMLGLGHLGQAFLWSLALLPHPQPSEVQFLLNDFDRIDAANYGSGLLCLPGAAGRMKTRHCAEWLERLGFQTTICERPFGTHTQRREDEPGVALCGFDQAEPRLHLDQADFGLVINAGLGGTLADFDQADIHVFPNARHSAREIWQPQVRPARVVDPKVAALFEQGPQTCGQLAIDIAGKSVSTSFVGAMTAALSVAELLRTFNHGIRFDEISFNARWIGDLMTQESTHSFTASAVGALGYAARY